ncbi:MAG: hypothetical protein Fur0026_04040 [Sideroxydans sp.]
MNQTHNDFQARLNGRFQGMLHWHQLDALWHKVKPGIWYVYQLGEPVPDAPLHGEALAQRVDALDALLRREHDEKYCGIVYADDAESPTLIKVYDPAHMGSSCSTTASPPGWIFSVAPPQAIELHAPVPNSRRRWWQLFST